MATGAFKVANGQVISPDGKPFIARGINVYDSLINEGSAMIAMFPGLNFVRVGIHAYNDPSSYQAFVTQMTSKGIVVAFEDHPDGGGGQDPAYTGSKLAAEFELVRLDGERLQEQPLRLVRDVQRTRHARRVCVGLGKGDV